MLAREVPPYQNNIKYMNLKSDNFISEVSVIIEGGVYCEVNDDDDVSYNYLLKYLYLRRGIHTAHNYLNIIKDISLLEPGSHEDEDALNSSLCYFIGQLEASESVRDIYTFY